MKLLSLIFLFLAIAFCSIPRRAMAQDNLMLHYSIADGLPSSNVYCAYRDSRGFLWFGTDKGIARYNGIRFEVFNTYNGLPDNEVFLFKEDPFGRLWMATFNGELCFYQDGIFHNAGNTSFLKMAAKISHINNITVEADSSVSFNFSNNTTLVNIAKEKKSIYDFAALNSSNLLFFKSKIGVNKFQLVFRDSVLYVDSLAHRISGFRRDVPGASIYVPMQDSGYFINIARVFSNESIASTGYIYSRRLDTITSFKDKIFSKKDLRAYYSAGADSFYCTSDGLVVNRKLSLLSENDISSMTQDAAGNFWVTTLNNGVWCISKNFLRSRSVNNGYKGEIRYCTGIDNSVFFVSRDFSLHQVKAGNVVCLFDFHKAQYAYDEQYREDAYLVEPSSSMFFNFKMKKCISYNFATNKVRVANYIDHVSGIHRVFRSGDNVYISFRSGLYQINYRALKENAELHVASLLSLRDQRLYSITSDEKAGIWFSTLTDMYRVQNNTVLKVPGFKNAVLKEFIFFKDRMLGYTHNNQLLVVDYRSDKLHIDTVIAQGCVWSKFYPLDSVHVLISTDGLYRVLTLRSDHSYEVSEVESAFVPRQASGIAMDSSMCYFFGNGVLTMIPKYTILEKVDPPKLYYTAVTASGHVYYNFNTSNQLQLQYDESNRISVSFARLVATGQAIRQQYSVSKSGTDDWRDIDGERIDLFNLGYGNYYIKIRAKTRSSIYCTPQVFTLTILKPFWAEWWFLALVAGALIMVAVVIVRFRIRYIIRKNEEKHSGEMKFVRSEYKALNALMNPHFVFNTLNNVQGLVNRGDRLAANEYIRVFADLIRQNMHNLSKEMIPLQREIELVVNYLLLEKLRFKELLNYSIDVDDKLDLSEIFIPPLLVQPLVENSIKHGILPLESVEGTVVIRIYEEDTLLYVQVRDNGVGLAKARENTEDSTHESFAMGNIKKRIEQLAIILNKQITLDMKEEQVPGETRQWTVVTISMQV